MQLNCVVVTNVSGSPRHGVCACPVSTAGNACPVDTTRPATASGVDVSCSATRSFALAGVRPVFAPAISKADAEVRTPMVGQDALSREGKAMFLEAWYRHDAN